MDWLVVHGLVEQRAAAASQASQQLAKKQIAMMGKNPDLPERRKPPSQVLHVKSGQSSRARERNEIVQ